MKKSIMAALGIILLSFAIAIYLDSEMPEMMASHWNAQGEVDGYMPKFWGLFLMPIISVVIFLLFLLIPKIDPLKRNIQKFRTYYDWFIVLFIAFFFYVYVLTLLFNLKGMDLDFNFTQMMVPALGILFYYLGILTENAKRNWFIGIRTPWTLSSDKVWDKTHKLGGKLFKIAGVMAFIGLLLPQYSILFAVIPVLVVALYTVVYSYIEYQK
jgi:uncharacterized membrane protein